MDDTPVDISGISQEDRDRIVRAAVRWREAQRLGIASGEAWDCGVRPLTCVMTRVRLAEALDAVLAPAPDITTALRRDDESARAGLVPSGMGGRG